MARRPQRSRTLRDLRAEAEAAEARAKEREAARATGPTGRPQPPRPQEPTRRKPLAQPRLRVVWAVCDLGGRTIATFHYRDKASAEAHAADLKARGKGDFFIRSIKEPIDPTDD